MIIATFAEGDTKETARPIHEATFRGVNDLDDVNWAMIGGKRYNVVRYVPNPQHPAYLFLVRPDSLEAHR